MAVHGAVGSCASHALTAATPALRGSLECFSRRRHIPCLFVARRAVHDSSICLQYELPSCSSYLKLAANHAAFGFGQNHYLHTTFYSFLELRPATCGVLGLPLLAIELGDHQFLNGPSVKAPSVDTEAVRV